MMLLVCFDLPRLTPKEVSDANRFRKHLINLGFNMKQYSLYEREVRRIETKNKLIAEIYKKIPETGEITLYELPDEVNNSQIVILGDGVFRKAEKNPEMIIL